MWPGNSYVCRTQAWGCCMSDSHIDCNSCPQSIWTVFTHSLKYCILSFTSWWVAETTHLLNRHFRMWTLICQLDLLTTLYIISLPFQFSVSCLTSLYLNCTLQWYHPKGLIHSHCVLYYIELFYTMYYPFFNDRLKLSPFSVNSYILQHIKVFK